MKTLQQLFTDRVKALEASLQSTVSSVNPHLTVCFFTAENKGHGVRFAVFNHIRDETEVDLTLSLTVEIGPYQGRLHLEKSNGQEQKDRATFTALQQAFKRAELYTESGLVEDLYSIAFCLGMLERENKPDPIMDVILTPVKEDILGDEEAEKEITQAVAESVSRHRRAKK